ncbi:GntR family transcriptional regulator [Maritalea sp.]|uniref:GntR family transcriptional regulator n=1 Tax=Maritalea sp. TaxID=2003361 RepID=UPI003EF7D481
MQQNALSGESNWDRFDLMSAILPLADSGATKLTPIYKKLHSALKNAIDHGVLSDGDELPSEKQLSSAFDMPTNSVRRALKMLSGEGLIAKQSDDTLCVNGRLAAPLSKSGGFTKDNAQNGHETHFDLLGCAVGEPTANEIDMLELAPGELVSRVHRVRFKSGKAVCVELACLPADVLENITEFSGSLYSYLDARGLKPSRGVQRVRAELMPKSAAQHLGVSPGSACLFVEQQSFLQSGAPIEYVQTHYRGDAYDFIVDIEVGA